MVLRLYAVSILVVDGFTVRCSKCYPVAGFARGICLVIRCLLACSLLAYLLLLEIYPFLTPGARLCLTSSPGFCVHPITWYLCIVSVLPGIGPSQSSLSACLAVLLSPRETADSLSDDLKPLSVLRCLLLTLLHNEIRHRITKNGRVFVFASGFAAKSCFCTSVLF